jgi:sugar phosphate isomerase/epimerase
VTFRQLPPREVIALAAANDMTAVEWGADVHLPPGAISDARDLRARCTEAGITRLSYGSYFRAGIDDRAELLPIVGTAAELGAHHIRVWAGDLGGAEASGEHRHAVAEDLRFLVALAETYGIEVHLEYHGDTLTDTVDSTLALLAEVPSVQPYWQPLNVPTPAEAARQVRALHPRTVHVFHWDKALRRHPLAGASRMWRAVLAELPGEAAAMVEFVEDDDPGVLAREVRTLREWIVDRVSADT